MIELPSDLAEVLKDVQGNQHGADIVFPDGNEELLAELAAAWEAWHQAADPAVRSIVASARTAMAHMSGTAADAFQQYYDKYAARSDSHAATTLDASAAVAQSFHGANQAVTQTKQEMIRELQYAKDYIASHPGGKHDDVSQSQGVQQAATAYHTYIGEVATNVDGMLRQNAGHIEAMNGAAQAARLHGATDGGGAGDASGAGNHGGPGGPGTGGAVPKAPSTLTPRVPGTQTAGTETLSAGTLAPPASPDLSAAGGLPDGGGPGGAGGGASGGGFGAAGAPQFSPTLPGGLGGAGSSGGPGAASGGGALRMSPLVPGALGGPGSAGSGSSGPPGGAQSFGGFNAPGPLTVPGASGGAPGGGDLGGQGGPQGGATLPGMRPFQAPTPAPFDPCAGGGVPQFTPLSGALSPKLSLSGLGGFDGGPVAGGSLQPWGSGGPGGAGAPGIAPLGSPGSIGLGGLGGLSGLGGAFGGGGRSGALGGGLKGTSGTSGGALSGVGGLGGGVGGGLGGGRVAAAAFGGGGAFAPGSARPGALGGSGLAARGAAGSASGVAGRVGSGLSGSGAAGGAGAGGTGGRTGGAAGAGGAHLPGGGGGGKRDAKRGTRFVRPTRFGAEGEEEEELLADSGVLGQATRHEGDPKWQRMRQRWLDSARSDAPARVAATHQAEPAADPEPETDPAQQRLAALKQLVNAVAGSDSATLGATTGGADGPAGSAGPATGAAAAGDPTESAANAYLDRAREVAARRGRPDAEPAAAAEPALPGAAADPASGGKPERGEIREEGGYKVPSPFLRAALAKLATSGAFEPAAES